MAEKTGSLTLEDLEKRENLTKVKGNLVRRTLLGGILLGINTTIDQDNKLFTEQFIELWNNVGYFAPKILGGVILYRVIRSYHNIVDYFYDKPK